jgi:hypothetical protein
MLKGTLTIGDLLASQTESTRYAVGRNIDTFEYPVRRDINEERKNIEAFRKEDMRLLSEMDLQHFAVLRAKKFYVINGKRIGDNLYVIVRPSVWLNTGIYGFNLFTFDGRFLTFVKQGETLPN